MKHIVKRIIIVLLIFASIIFVIEQISVANINHYKPDIAVSFSNNEYIMNWTKTPYPCYYKIEVLTQPPQESDTSPAGLTEIVSYHTWNNTYPLNLNFPNNTYWRVSAQGIFAHPIGQYSDVIQLADITGVNPKQTDNIKPTLLSNYTEQTPAAIQTILQWSKVPGAVYYELELSTTLPQTNTIPSESKFFSTREIFSNGYNANLPHLMNQPLYWRVRAYDYNDNPLGVYSDPGTLYISPAVPYIIKPIINCFFNVDGKPTPLYPVYSWLPIAGISTYEVEITDYPPENPNGTEPSRYRIGSKTISGGSDLYDETPRIIPGVYYWRVRGIDAAGHAAGVWSDTEQFVVDVTTENTVATFGDSITHGGGCISYSPSDWEYSFQTYLDFSTVNLGKSGDTSESLAERFDRDVLPFHPRYLIIMGGTNSLREGIPASEVIKDLTNIRNKCITHGIRPIFLTLPPINPANIQHAFNEETVPNWRGEFAAVNTFIRQQHYYIDLAPYFTNSLGELPTYYAADGLHYDIEGKKLMAQIINAHWATVSR